MTREQRLWKRVNEIKAEARKFCKPIEEQVRNARKPFEDKADAAEQRVWAQYDKQLADFAARVDAAESEWFAEIKRKGKP